MAARSRMPLDRPALVPLPLPARFEQREEYERKAAELDREAKKRDELNDFQAYVDNLKTDDVASN